MKPAIAKFLNAAINSACPFPCPACGHGEGEARNLFCPACREKLFLIRPPRCPGCGGTLDGVLELCSRCMRFERRPWRGALALFELRGMGQGLVHRFKFRDSPELARPFAGLAVRLLQESEFPIDAVVPVPLHWSRCFIRGYNQAALLSEEISRRCGIPCLRIMRRVKRTRQQATLDREQRQKNLENAFAVQRHLCIDGKSLLLVDDVMTTGATLNAAASTLLQHGAGNIYILVVGRR